MKMKLFELRAIIREAIQEAAPMFGDEFEPEHDDTRGVPKHLHPTEKEDVGNFSRFNAAYKHSKLTPQDSKPWPEDNLDWDDDAPSPDYPNYEDVDAAVDGDLPEGDESKNLTDFVRETNKLAQEDGHSFDDVKHVMKTNKMELKNLISSGHTEEATALVMHHLNDYTEEDKDYARPRPRGF
jgi:hypothetical protein